jgi:hypothetical protein
MNCTDSSELLIEYSLGHLDASRARELHEHLQGGCEMCARELADINETWARMAADLVPVPPSPEIEAKLLAMIRGQVLPTVSRSDATMSSQRGQPRLMPYILAASLVGVAAGFVAINYTPLGTMLAYEQPVDKTAGMWGPAPSHQSEGFQTVALNTIAEKRGTHVSVVMIPQSQEWHVVATGLPAIRDGETYRFWLEGKSGEFVRSAALSIENDGRGGVVVNMADLKPAELSGVWLTQEADSDSSGPSETVLFRAVFK